MPLQCKNMNFASICDNMFAYRTMYQIHLVPSCSRSFHIAFEIYVQHTGFNDINLNTNLLYWVSFVPMKNSNINISQTTCIISKVIVF